MNVITDLSSYTCLPTATIREVLLRLDRSVQLFQIVLDEHGRLLGTITDGDIRRAMLNGITVDHPASACMQTRPKTGVKGDHRGNQLELSKVPSRRSFLPILDDAGSVSEVLVREDRDNVIAHALVMAGGYGTRLGERTRDVPKPMLSVAGRPILDHVLAALEDAGTGTIYVSVHYLAEKIRSYLRARNNRAEIRVVVEAEPLGTAGALGLLTGLTGAPLLVVNGDVITDVDYAAVHDFHNRHAFDATIGVTRYEIEVPFGVVRYTKEGFFDGIEEKPRVSNFVAAGVYYLSTQLVQMVPEGKRMDMPELLNSARQLGQAVGLFPIHEYWTDVGRPVDLEAANHKLSNPTSP